MESRFYGVKCSYAAWINLRKGIGVFLCRGKPGSDIVESRSALPLPGPFIEDRFVRPDIAAYLSILRYF